MTQILMNTAKRKWVLKDTPAAYNRTQTLGGKVDLDSADYRRQLGYNYLNLEVPELEIKPIEE
jgi:hypothetical protein